MALFIFTKNTTGGNSLNTESVALRGFEPNLNRNNLNFRVGEWDAGSNDLHNIILNANLADLPASSSISAIRIKLHQISMIGTKAVLVRTGLRPWTQTTATWNSFTTSSLWAESGGAYNAADADINTANQISYLKDSVNNLSYITVTLSAAQIADAQAAYAAGNKLNLVFSHGTKTSANQEVNYEANWGADAKRPIIEVDYTTSATASPPVNTVPAAQTGTTNTSKAITGVRVNDIDGNLSTTRVTASLGSLAVSLAGGATISLGANNSATLTLSGTQTQINAALATLTYIHTTAGTFTITVLSTDSSATPLTGSDTFNIALSAPLSAPVNTVPGAKTTLPDTATPITGVSVNDADGNLATTKLTVINGKVSVTLGGGATISAGVNSTTTLTLSGTQTQINDALATISYTSNAGYSGSDTLTVLSTDSSGTPLTDTDTISITVNSPPVNTVPSGQTAGTNVAKAITGISVADADNNLATTKLTASNGTITVSLAGGATISVGANNTATLTLSGTLVQINAALATVSYTASVAGVYTITILSTDTAGTPLTDTDAITITVKDVYATQGADFNATGMLSNGVVLNGNGKWAPPAGTTTWTFTVQTLADAIYDENNEFVSLTVNGVTATASLINNPSSTINPISEIFVTEASYGLLSSGQRTAAETGGGYPLFVVTKNTEDIATGFDVQMATTSNGVYSNYLTDQPFTPTALVNGIIDKTHPTFAITNESNMPNTITADTKGLLYDSIGQREWVQLNNLATKTILGETARVFEGVGAAIWDSGMPIQVGQEDVARIAVLTAPSIGAMLADGVQRFFKVIPKVIGGSSINPALVTPIALTIASKSRRPYNVRKVIFVRNETPEYGSSFPDGNIDQGATNIYYYPSSRTEVATSNFTSPAPAFETGVTVHVDVKTVGGETLIRTINGGTIDAHYSETNRAADIARYSTQYEVYTKKNLIESERFIWVVQQQIPQNNTVTAVTPTFLAGNVRTAVQLAATAGGAAGTGQETGVYLVRLSGTLFPTVNMDSMSIDAAAATILSYDKTKGELIVVAPRALASFTLITPYTGTGTITVFAGYRLETWPGESGITNTATI